MNFFIYLRLKQDNYVRFVNGNGCYSYIGRVNVYPQVIYLSRGGCLEKEIKVHEFMHALGKFDNT